MRQIVVGVFLFVVLACPAADVERLTVEYQALSVDRTDRDRPLDWSMMLAIGDSISKFYWVPEREFRERNLKAYNLFDLYSVYKNYPVKEQLTFCGDICNVAHSYTEPLPVFDWEILEGDSVVCGYNCQKAQTAFRGRTWVVWFSADLPYSDGPWKLCGLPGLILKAYDTKGCFCFNAIEIKNGNSREIEVDMKKTKKSSPEKFAKEMLTYAKDPDQYNLDLGRNWVGRTITYSNGKRRKIHINPWTPNLMEYFEEGK